MNSLDNLHLFTSQSVVPLASLILHWRAYDHPIVYLNWLVSFTEKSILSKLCPTFARHKLPAGSI